MKDKLRELAKRWFKETNTPCIDFLHNSADRSKRRCATELLAILDAEGDGSAVWNPGDREKCFAEAVKLRAKGLVKPECIEAAIKASLPEGDGGVVAWQDALIYAGDQYADKYKGDDCQDIKTDVLNAFYHGADWMRKHHPARSGVVSEEDVHVALERFTALRGESPINAMRAALESYERNRK